MNGLKFEQQDRSQRTRKSKVYKEMLDEQIRSKRQMMRRNDNQQQQDRIYTQPDHIPAQSRFRHSEQNYDIIENQESTFLPIISHHGPNSSERGSMLLNVKKPKHLLISRNLCNDSNDQTEKYLRDCQQIINNLKQLTSQSLKRTKNKRTLGLQNYFSQPSQLNHLSRKQKHYPSYFSSSHLEQPRTPSRNRSKKHQPEILRISMPEEQGSVRDHNKHNKKEPTHSDQKRTERTKNKVKNNLVLQNQFEDSQQKLPDSSRKQHFHDRKKTISYDEQSRNSGRKNKQRKSSGVEGIVRDSLEKSIESNQFNQHFFYKNQQMDGESSKNKKHPIKQVGKNIIDNNSNQGKVKNKIGVVKEDVTKKEEELSRSQRFQQSSNTDSKIESRNSLVLQHLMKARQRGTLLFKKIQQYKGHRQQLQRAKERQGSSEMTNQ